MAAVNLKQVRIVLWTLVVVAALGATALFVFAPPKNPQTAGFGGGTYTLVDHRGNALDQTMLVGHPSLLVFGYTHCPGVSPTTMGEMAAWYQALGDEAKDLRGYFVTVDPERDTPEIVGGYAGWVSDKMSGVTGTPEEIAKIVKAWGVLAEKVPGEGDDYTMNHTASVFLVNSRGEFEGTIAYQEDQDTALAKIRKLIGES
jgi:protein SCO1/2